MLEKFLDQIEFDSYADFLANYRLKVPEGFNFAYDVIDAWAESDPDKPALHWLDDFGLERTFTFADLKRYSDQAANMFKAKGIGRGDTVMLMLRQYPEVWFSFLGLHKLGAVVIPASFQLTTKDIAYRVNAASVKLLVVADPEMVEQVNLARGECPTLKETSILAKEAPVGWTSFLADLDAASPEWEKPYPRPGGSEPMLIYFSSGTTGMPKMILHDFVYPLGHIVTAKYWQQVEDGGLHLTVTDSGWAKFGWGKIYGQWICGAVLVGYESQRFEPLKLLSVMERLRLTTFCAPPTVYRFLIKEDLSRFDLSSIHHASTAGEPLNPVVYDSFRDATGIPICEGFGQSESSVLFANFAWFPVKPGSTGKPSPLYALDLVDEDGKSCEDGVVGTIVVRGLDHFHPPGLFREYFRDPASMAGSFTAGVYSTGDTAWRDADGYYWFVGRNDDVIKCSGYRIGPFEVESVLMTHPAVLECAITAAPDPIRGQVVKATVVLSRGYSPTGDLARELQEHVKKATAPYKYPRLVDFVTELPKTTSGKIRRTLIRGRDQNPGLGGRDEGKI